MANKELPGDHHLWQIVGRNITKMRQAAAMTQAELADAVGLTRTAITNAESGKQRLPVQTIYAIALVLGGSAYDLLPATHPLEETVQHELAVLNDQRRKILQGAARRLSSGVVEDE